MEDPTNLEENKSPEAVVQAAEKSEKSPDLREFIISHGEIALSKDDPEFAELEEYFKKPMSNMHERDLMSGDYLRTGSKGEWNKDQSRFIQKNEIYFKNNSGGISRVETDNSQISAYDDFLTREKWGRSGVGWDKEVERYDGRLDADMSSIGLRKISSDSSRNSTEETVRENMFREALEKAILKKKERLEKEAQEQKKEGFNL